MQLSSRMAVVYTRKATISRLANLTTRASLAQSMTDAHHQQKFQPIVIKSSCYSTTGDAGQNNSEINKKIEAMIKKTPIAVFMKGEQQLLNNFFLSQ
jgi:hypothetical protein